MIPSVLIIMFLPNKIELLDTFNPTFLVRSRFLDTFER